MTTTTDGAMVFDLRTDASFGPMPRTEATAMQRRAEGTLRAGSYTVVERDQWDGWDR